MAHTILSADIDKLAIDSFISGVQIDLNSSLFIGTQIYYLYKEEEDDTILSWYWGCVIDIDKTKENGEYYHIYHDDEDPWIDLAKDRTDWKIIDTKNPYYDDTFDLNPYLINNKKHTQSEKTATNSTDETYAKGQNGFVSIDPEASRISCTINQGPSMFKAVRLRHLSCMNPYTFWCRTQDIKQTSDEVCVAFEHNGKISQYRVIDENEEKQFIECVVRKRKDMMNTRWISTLDFQSKCILNTGNKENEDKYNAQDIIVKSAHDLKRSFSRKKTPETCRTRSKKEMDSTPTPSASPKQRRMSVNKTLDMCHAGDKRKRNENISWNVWPPLKKQRLSAMQNDDDILQFVANETLEAFQENKNHNKNKQYVLSDDVSSIGSETEEADDEDDSSPAMLKNIGINVETNAICNEFKENQTKRETLSEPPPKQCSEERSDNMIPICFPLISLQDITNKLTDGNISDEERIESLKSVVLYLTKCEDKMRNISKQIFAQCQNVIRCVEAIIHDLQQSV